MQTPDKQKIVEAVEFYGDGSNLDKHAKLLLYLATSYIDGSIFASEFDIENEVNMAIDRVNKKYDGRSMYERTRYGYVKEVVKALSRIPKQKQEGVSE